MLYFNAMQAAGAALGLTSVSVIVDSPSRFDVAALTRERLDALYVFPNATLVINLKTAKTLGLTIPQSALIRADEMIR